MFKKTKRKIVAAIMSILVGLFLGTLAIIYLASYNEVSDDNFDRLAHYAEQYDLADHGKNIPFWNRPEADMEPVPGEKPGRPYDPSFRLATFYSVALTEDGEVLATDIGDRGTYDEETLEDYAEDILDEDERRGTQGSLAYLVVRKNGYILVAFMDNTVVQNGMWTLFRYTLLFGSVALVALFFLARYLAKKIVDPLEQSYQKQKQFISDAGHELKTPISVIGANAELLGRALGDNPWLSNIQYENERMGNLVGQLLKLARTEDMKPQMVLLDFTRLVAGGTLPFESVAFEAGLTINTQIAQGVTVRGSESHLRQLVAILLDNAIQYGKSGKEIWVQLSQTRHTAVLTVVNAGAAIPPEKLAHLFDRFYRADEARSDAGNHYGLGLAIAKAIVEAHHGHIGVRCYNGLVEFRATLSKL